MVSCILIAVERTYIFQCTPCYVQCERQPFLVCLSMEIIIIISFYCRSFSPLSMQCVVWIERMRHVGTQCTYILQHFTKWHVFVLAPLCKSVSSKRLMVNEKSLNLCTIHMVFLFNQIQCTPRFFLLSFARSLLHSFDWGRVWQKRPTSGKPKNRDKRCNILSIHSQFNLANWFSM